MKIYMNMYEVMDMGMDVDMVMEMNMNIKIIASLLNY
jgi:hypothetical protein